MTRLADLLEAPENRLEADADIEAIYELCLERGWSDGLPVIPPTPARDDARLLRPAMGRAVAAFRRVTGQPRRCGSPRTP